MGERPILFSTPMVKAILDGRKSQTRRVLKPQPNLVREPRHPYHVGQRLWVRETWAHYQTINHILHSGGRAFDEASDGLAGYRADGHDTIEDFRTHVRIMSGCDLVAVEIHGDRWRPSIHMPRWASRLTLTVTDARVQRLQDISEADARAEGVEWMNPPASMPDATPEDIAGIGYQYAFATLWNSINAKRPGCSWKDNPWVVVVGFSAERRNIDAGAPHA